MSGTAPFLLALQPSVIPVPRPLLPDSSSLNNRSSWWSRSRSRSSTTSTRKLSSHSLAGAPVKSAGDDCDGSAAAACSCRGWILLHQTFPAEFAVPHSPSLLWVVGVRSSRTRWNPAASSSADRSFPDGGCTKGSSFARRRKRRSNEAVGAVDLPHLDSCGRPRLRRSDDEASSSSSSCGSAAEAKGRTAAAAAESRGGDDDDDHHHPSAGDDEKVAHSRRRALSTTLLVLLSFSVSVHFRRDAAAAAATAFSPSTPVDFSPGYSGLRDWLRGQKQRTASFLLAPINASRERLASALQLVSSNDVSGASYEEAGGLVKVAARDCMPLAAGSILDFQKRSGVEVCTFKLVLKNAASLLDKGDPTKIKAEESLDDLIRSFVILDGMLASRTSTDRSPDRKNVMGALDHTSGALNRFEANVRACLGIA